MTARFHKSSKNDVLNDLIFEADIKKLRSTADEMYALSKYGQTLNGFCSHDLSSEGMETAMEKRAEARFMAR